MGDKLSFRLPNGMKNRLEDVAQKEGYINSSELVREMIRQKVNQSRPKRVKAKEVGIFDG